MIRVIGVGDNTVDTYLHMRMMFPGGNAVNVPVFARRYGHRASYIGWLGQDQRGQLILDALAAEDVDTSRCRVVDGPNGFCEVTIQNGDRVFGDYASGVCHQIKLTDHDYDFVARHDLTHTSIYSAIEVHLPRLSDAARHLSFDFSQDWDRRLLQDTAVWVDIALLSFPGHTLQETEDLASWVHDLGPRVVIVTRGSDSAVACDRIRTYHQPILETEVVDTLGAGDAFAARFMVDYLDGADVPTALASAARSGAEACTWYGAFGHGIPF
jgi:fructoselysine 6-kinase